MTELAPGLSQLAIAGDVGPKEAITLNELLKGLVAKKGKIIVQMASTTYFGSTAIAALVNAALQLEQAGGHLALACVPGKILHILRLFGLVPGLRIFDTVDLARQSFESRSS